MSDDVSGLIFGADVSLQSDGDLVCADTLLENQSLDEYLDTVSTGLMFRNGCDSLVVHAERVNRNETVVVS